MIDASADPFEELGWRSHRKVLSVLGARLDIETNHRGLLALASRAFDGLPQLRVRNSRPLRMVLKCSGNGSGERWRSPPVPRLTSGDDFLFSSFDGGNYALVSPKARTALVHVSAQALRFPYHVRYELIEFAGLTLAARAQRLVPLHAACVCRQGHGILLLGESGAGKSTLCLSAALAGFELLAEDSVFVSADRLLATGVSNYLHLRDDGLKFVDDTAARRALRGSPTIRRRSGVRKLEFDLRAGVFPVARRAVPLAAVVVLSAQRALGSSPLRSLDGASVLRVLRDSQAYARTRPGWKTFERNVARLPAYRLSRGAHPREGAQALLDQVRMPRDRQ